MRYLNFFLIFFPDFAKIILLMKNILCVTILVESSPQALPLGLACIASSIKNNSLTKDLCNVDLIALNPEDKTYIFHSKNDDELAEYISKIILDKNPNIVCFSVFVWNRKILEKTSILLKKNNIITIAGGPEITANINQTFNFDYTIAGPGENQVPQLIYKLIKNKSDNSEKAVYDLEMLPSPYLDNTLNTKEYDGALWELARGCPFKCSYCYESKGEKKVSYFPIERIKKELDLFAKNKVPQVFVLDPTYNANKKRAIELINLIAQKTPDTFYYFEARSEFIDRELAHAFTKITCALQIGLQSANEEVLKLVNRPFNKSKFVKNIGYLNQEGVIFGLDLIYGLPKESLKSFKNGINFALSLYPNNLEIFRLSVLPGTDLFDRADELKLNYMKEPPYHVINTDFLSHDDIKHAENLSHACNYFYNLGRAVPWFNIICNNLHLSPVNLLEKFFNFSQTNKINLLNCCQNHLEIQKVQIEFIKSLLQTQNKTKYILLASDIIRMNGAISRTIDSGKEEILDLNYESEYLYSEYISDFDFFLKNVKQKKSKIKIYMTSRGIDFKKI